MNKSTKSVAILGCGWLGFPMGRQLLRNGWKVNGSTTSSGKMELLQTAGINPFLIQVRPEGILGEISGFLSGAEVLIIDYPPGMRNQAPEQYIEGIRQLVHSLKGSSVKNVLFVSSISVYEDSEEFPEYTEENTPNASSARGRSLRAAEKLIASEPEFNTSILRLGGLIGEDRHPVYQLSGRKELGNPEAPVNLITRPDCIGIVEAILEKGIWGEEFNAVFPTHPKKQDYYSQKAREYSLPLPEFGEGLSKGKIINPGKVQRILNYELKGRL